MKTSQKYLFSLFMVVVLMFQLSGCGNNFNAKGLVLEVLRCLDEEDSESLKSLLCAKTLARPTIDDEIKAAMEFYQGKSISHGLVSSGSGGKAFDNGKRTMLKAAPFIDNIRTNDGRIYQLGLFTYFVFSKDREKEGIVYLSIKSDEEQECLVGEWLD